MNREEQLQQDIKDFEWDWNNGGSFRQTICKAITIADSNNLQLLHKAFPKLVNGFVGYAHGMDWEDFSRRMIKL